LSLEGARADTFNDAAGRHSADFPWAVTQSLQPTGKSTLPVTNFDESNLASFFVMYAEQPEGDLGPHWGASTRLT
jgi:hypothetical protein